MVKTASFYLLPFLHNSSSKLGISKQICVFSRENRAKKGELSLPKITIPRSIYVFRKKKSKKIYTARYGHFLQRKFTFFCSIFADFHAKTRKFAYRWPTLNLNCAKTVTDRNMGFSPISHICPEVVSLGSACVSNTYCICRRRFMSYFCPEFCDMSEMVMFTDPPRTGDIQ